jgi:hypothetical protein
MMTTNETITSPPISPSALRMRLHRKRRLRGMTSLTVWLHVTEIDGLVRKGLLRQERRNEKEALRGAIYEVLARALGV